jgi:hypothetical protein
MPPIYQWQELETGTVVDIMRPFDSYQDPPNEEEIKEAGLDPATAKFRKIIGKTIVHRGDTWGKKGALL